MKNTPSFLCIFLSIEKLVLYLQQLYPIDKTFHAMFNVKG